MRELSLYGLTSSVGLFVRFYLFQSHTKPSSRPPARACTSHILVYCVLALLAQLIKGLEICNAIHNLSNTIHGRMFFNERL